MKLSRIIPIIKITVGLGIVLIIVMWMSGSFREKVSPDAEVESQINQKWDGPTAVVESAEQPLFEHVVGSIQAARRITVSSKIMAQVLKITINAGDQVKKDDLIIELDSRDLRARTDQAKQNRDAAKATYDRVLKDFERAEKLSKTGNITQSQFDNARSERDIALAALESAKRALDENQIALTYSQIRSPAAGRVVERFVEVGDMVSPGQNLLDLYDPQRLRLEAPVRESLASSLAGKTFEVTIDAIQTTLEGQVDEIVPQAELGARTFLLKISLPKHEGLYPGMFGRMKIPVSTEKQLFLPEKAVERIGQLQFVNVVDPNGTIHRRAVTLGKAVDRERIEILTGIRSGETAALLESIK